METDAVRLNSSSDKAASSILPEAETQNAVGNISISQEADESNESNKTPATEVSRVVSGSEVSEERPKTPQNVSIDEDDLSAEQIFHGDKPPLVLLREIAEDGNEKITSNHSTSAGFTFQNSLIYELD